MKTLYKSLQVIFLLLPVLAFARPTRPSAILVMLNVESRKIGFFEKNGQTEKKRQVIEDALEARTAMVNDFNDHFHLCPVYYYMDTNFKRVMNREFDGVLLDKDLNPLASSPFSEADTNYLIVYYGLKAANEDPDSYAGAPAISKGLNVTDFRFKSINAFRTYIPKKLDLFNKVSKYRYSSPYNDISYFDLAERLWNIMSKAY